MSSLPYLETTGLSSNSKKWIIAIITGIIAVIVFSPLVYQLTNTISSRLRGPLLARAGGPTGWGLLIQFILFVIIVRLLMGF